MGPGCYKVRTLRGKLCIFTQKGLVSGQILVTPSMTTPRVRPASAAVTFAATSGTPSKLFDPIPGHAKA